MTSREKASGTVYNPATGELVNNRIPIASEEDVDEAVKARHLA